MIYLFLISWIVAGIISWRIALEKLIYPSRAYIPLDMGDFFALLSCILMGWVGVILILLFWSFKKLEGSDFLSKRWFP